MDAGEAGHTLADDEVGWMEDKVSKSFAGEALGVGDGVDHKALEVKPRKKLASAGFIFLVIKFEMFDYLILTMLKLLIPGPHL